MTTGAARGRRLLYVGTLPPHQGGTAIVAAQLLPALAKLGYRIETIAPITQAALGSGDPFAERNGDIEVSRFVVPYLDVSPDSPPPEDYRRREQQSSRRLVTASIERERPDLILIGRESFGAHVVPVARAQSVPSVVLIQGATTMGIVNGSYPPHLATQLLDNLNLADVAVTSAPHMRRTLAGLGLRHVEIVPNPVDLERFRPLPHSSRLRARLGVPNGAVVVAHLSNLKALKRPLDLVDAAEVALAQDNGLVFVIVGDGPCRTAVEDACAARGISGAFRFPGWVAHEEVPEYINVADIVVMPSAGEAQALVYLETQACERTLIASDIPAAREVVDHGRTGLLFRTRDTAHLTEMLLMAARDPALRARIGRRARERVAEHGLDRVVAAYDELLESAATQGVVR